MGFKLFLILEKFLMVMPSSFRFNFFSFLGKIAYYASPKYRKIAHQNIDFVFNKTKTEDEKIYITKYAFKNLMLNFLHLMELRNMSKDEFAKKITMVNTEQIQKIHDDNRSIIYITTHYSSWEFAGASIGAFIEPLIPVYKEMKNKSYQKWVLEARDSFGNISMEKTNIVRPLIKNLKSGMASGLLIDTNINHKEGIIIDFMGKTLRQTSTPAYLARKLNAAIIPVEVRTDDDKHFTITLQDELKIPKTDNIEDDIRVSTQLQADWLAGMIRKEPKFWFWIHRRFKNDHPEIYQK
jgi:KDO2-lipid IV(A) lauroyltransferase